MRDCPINCERDKCFIPSVASVKIFIIASRREIRTWGYLRKLTESIRDTEKASLICVMTMEALIPTIAYPRAWHYEACNFFILLNLRSLPSPIRRESFSSAEISNQQINTWTCPENLILLKFSFKRAHFIEYIHNIQRASGFMS